MGITNRILPSEAVSAAPRVILEGRTALLIEQHRGILGYTEAEAVVRMKEGLLRVRGEGLCIACYDADQVMIEAARIDALEFRA